MTCTSNTLVLLREGLGGFSITHSGILRDGAFARPLTPQRCAFKAISIGSAKARTRDFLLVLELYHLFCHIVGGVISPAIANMALDGLSQQLTERFPCSKRGKSPQVHLARYADDFIVTGASKELLEQEVKPFIEAFMKERGLTLSPEKTVITHMQDGFDFLGQQVRKYQSGSV